MCFVSTEFRKSFEYDPVYNGVLRIFSATVRLLLVWRRANTTGMC